MFFYLPSIDRELLRTIHHIHVDISQQVGKKKYKIGKKIRDYNVTLLFQSSENVPKSNQVSHKPTYYFARERYFWRNKAPRVVFLYLQGWSNKI